MGISYTVKKNKLGRYGYRLVGVVFALAGLLGFFLLTKIPNYQLLVASVGAIALLYGAYLIKASFRLQAYDITYDFTEEHIKLRTKRGEKILPYDEIVGAQYVQPSPDVDYVMIQIRHGKKQYVLHFNRQQEQANKVYDYLEKRVPSMRV